MYRFTELFYKLHITIHNEECQRRLDVYLHTAYGTILCICCTGLVVLYSHPACSMAICKYSRPGPNYCELSRPLCSALVLGTCCQAAGMHVTGSPSLGGASRCVCIEVHLADFGIFSRQSCNSLVIPSVLVTPPVFCLKQNTLY